jgi:hypothetical protein
MYKYFSWLLLLSWLIVDICSKPQAVVAFSAHAPFFNPKTQRRCWAFPVIAMAGTDDEIMFSGEEHADNEDVEI